jgi:hypothetical protein
VADQQPKFCPFCRSRRNHVEQLGRLAHVHCDDCGADGPPATGAADAVQLWNKRAAGPKKGDGGRRQ